jgi:hypothetical protein
MSNWHLHRARIFGAAVLTNLTLRECSSACDAAVGCDSFSRQAVPVADCILGDHENHCGGSLLPRLQWHVWHRTAACPSCTVGLRIPQQQLPSFQVRADRAEGWDIVTEPSTDWVMAERRTCASQTFLARLDDVVLSACQDACNTTTDCYAIW